MLQTTKVSTKVQLVAQDIKISKLLAGNSKKVREKTLRNLRKWLNFRSLAMPFTEEDFSRLWKGLFYTMWMSDKPLVQEECAESIASLVHFEDEYTSLLFFKVGLKTLINEWFGIDQLRLDKFLMLVRRLLRQGFEVCHTFRWNNQIVEDFSDVLVETVLSTKAGPPLGLVMHFTDIYLEELAKISNGTIDVECTTEFLRPFAVNLIAQNDKRQINTVINRIFRYLLYQSDLGLEYKEKYNIWRQRKFEGGSIDCIEKMEMSDEEDYEENEKIDSNSMSNNMPKDPRAGRVDVVLSQIPVDFIDVLDLLKKTKLKYLKVSTTAGRKAFKIVESEYNKMANGVFPLGTKEVPVVTKATNRLNVNAHAESLLEFEDALMNDDDEFQTTVRTRSKKRKHSMVKIVNDDDDDNAEEADNAEQQEEEEAETDSSPVKTKKQKVTKTQDKSAAQIAKNEKRKAAKALRQEQRQQQQLVANNTVANATNGFVDDDRFEDALNDAWMNPHCFRRKSGVWYVSDVTAVPPAKTKKTAKKIKPAVAAAAAAAKKSSEWDVPLQDGEVEFYMPANKYKCKLRSVPEMHTPERDVIVKNPFATPNSEKKVKIALNLNRSQETSEYQKQLKASPQIPFDAERKPSKPLLKASCVPSPINPFYKRKLRMSMV